MLKASNGTTQTTSYIIRKKLKRTYPKVKEPKPIKPSTSEQLKELGLSIINVRL
jgi:hypothetical protein